LHELSHVGALNDTSTQHKSEGFQLAGQEENLECRLKEILYGQIQAPRLRYLKFDSFIQKDKAPTWHSSTSLDSCNEEPCSDVHQVGDEREVKVLDSFNWPSSELITEDGVLPERDFDSTVQRFRAVALLILVQNTLYRKSPSPAFGGAYHVVQIQWDKWSVTLEQVVCGCRSVRTGQELYTVQRSVQRIESARATLKAHLPYGMFLTRLFRHVMEHYPHLDNGIYNAVDRVMHPLALKQTWKPEVIVEKPVTPSHQLPPIIIVDLHLTKDMMMRMMVLPVLVPHLLPPT
ncbi:hypothetical protein Tco_1142869, partial [Tanacetum coccineum]